MNDTNEAVLELRKGLGDTQQQFAHRLGVAIATAVRYETTRPPKGKALAMLAELAALRGFDKQATVLREALAAELGAWSTSDFKLDLDPRTDTEKLWVSATLAVLRNSQYSHLIPKLAALLAEPANTSIEIAKAAIQGKKTRLEAERLLRLNVDPQVIAEDLNIPSDQVETLKRIMQFQTALQRASERKTAK